MYRFSRSFNADNLPSFALPPQLADPALRGGEALFPNLRVGKFGREALAHDLTPYRVAKMFRPDVINMASTNPARQVKALEDIQFQKAGQSPGQAKALGELIRKDPTLGNSFNIGYGSTLNREQGLAQKEGRVYEFDPTDEMWKSGFKRKNPSIVAMDDLQDALMTMPSGGRLTTYDGRPLDPAFTKAYYNLEAAQDLNDPQLFYNLKGKADVDYGRIAQALDSVPKDINKKADYSLAKRWERVQGYSPYPPSGTTYVLNADKPYQSVDEIMAEVNQVEPWRTPRMADSRIARSQNSGNSDFNIIPKDYTRKEYLEATGDSDNLPPLDYAPNNTLVELFGGIAADRDGNTFPLTRLKRKESSVIGREFDESNAKSAFTFPIETKRAYKLLRDGNPVIEDRTFLLNSPTSQAPVRAMASVLPPGYYSQRERDIPTGIRQLDLFNNTDPYLRMAVDENNNPIYRSELPANYYGVQRDIPTSLRAIEEGLTGRKGSVIGYVDSQPQRATTRLGTQYTTPFINPYRQALPQGEIELANGMVVNQYTPVKPPELAREAWAEESVLNPNTSKRIKGLEPYYRIAGQNYMVGEKEGLARPFYTPEVILPESLARKTPMYFEGTGGISPNNYRITGSTSEPGGYNEFNEVMDKGVRISKRLDRLYKENDELADLASLPFFAPQGEAIAYQQSDILDRIVDAERAAERMGGVQRRLSGKKDQGSFEEERMAYEGRPSALTQYNINDVLGPSFGSDYSGRTNTGRIRTSVGTEYDAGIPVSSIVKTRLANQAIDPIQLQDDFAEPFNQAQYTRDLIDRGGVLIDTQLGIPILKAPTTAYNPITQREAIVNVGGAEITTPKNITYLQPVRPSRVANGVANWQAPESLAVGRVGMQIPIENIPELPINTGYSTERAALSPTAVLQKQLLNSRIAIPNPLPEKNLYIDGINYGRGVESPLNNGAIYVQGKSNSIGPVSPMRRAALPSRALNLPQGEVLYPRNTRIEDDLSSYIKWLSDNQTVKQNPLMVDATNMYVRSSQPTIGQQLGIEPRIAQPFNPQAIYPNAGVGPLNTGLKPKPTIGELFGFTALTPEGLAKYRDMG